MLLLAALTAGATGHAGMWLLLVIASTGLLLGTGHRSALSRLPAAVALSCALVVTGLTAADLLGAAVLASPARARAFLVLLTCIVAVPGLLARQGTRSRLAERDELMSCSPAAVLVLLIVWLSRRDLPGAVGAFLSGWDNGAHVLFTADIATSGGLSYGTQGYPRGLHAVVALVLNTRSSFAPTPGTLAELLRTQNIAVWTLYALLCATVALTTLRLAALHGLVGRRAVGTATGASLVTLSPYFFGFTMQYGFETTIAVALVLAILSLELVQRHTCGVSLVVTAAAATLTAHTYQLLLPVLALPLIVEGVVLLRRRPRGWRTAVALTLVLLLGALPPALSVLRNIGVAAVAIAGEAPALPLLWLIAGLVAALCTSGGRRPQLQLQLQLLASMVLVLIGLALVSAALSGAALTDYYPRKLLWHAALVSLPSLAVAVRIVLSSLARRISAVAFVRLLPDAVALLGLPVLLLLAVPGPYMALSGGWSVGDQTVASLLHPDDERQFCEVESDFGRQVASRLSVFYATRAMSPVAVPRCPDDPVRRQPAASN